MSYVLIVYESKTGNVQQMAEAVSEGVKSAGLGSKLVDVNDAGLSDVLDAAGIIVGSYTSYGILAGSTKTFFDKTVSIHGKLKGKVGGAFASSGKLGGGNETTILSIIQMLLVHGMIIQGDSKSPHFGAVAIGKPDGDSLKSCKELGRRVSELIKALDHQ